MIQTEPSRDNTGREDWGSRLPWVVDERDAPGSPAGAHRSYKEAQTELDKALYAFEMTGGQSNELALESAFSLMDDRASAAEEFFGLNDEKGCTCA